jgi:hypothetical protein
MKTSASATRSDVPQNEEGYKSHPKLDSLLQQQRPTDFANAPRLVGKKVSDAVQSLLKFHCTLAI